MAITVADDAPCFCAEPDCELDEDFFELTDEDFVGPGFGGCTVAARLGSAIFGIVTEMLGLVGFAPAAFADAIELAAATGLAGAVCDLASGSLIFGGDAPAAFV